MDKAVWLKCLGIALAGAVFALAKHFGLDDANAAALSAATGGAFGAGVFHPVPGAK